MPAEAVAAAPPKEAAPIMRATAIPGELGQVRNTWWTRFTQYVGHPNPDKLDVATYDKMLVDPMVRDAILMRDYSVLGKPASFNYDPLDSDDLEEDALGTRMVAWLDWVWENLAPGGVEFLEWLLHSRRYGFTVIEKVWASTVNSANEPVLRVLPAGHEFAGFAWIERVKRLPPTSIQKNGIGTDQYGNVTFVAQNILHFMQPGYEQATGAVTARPDPTGLAPWAGMGRITFSGADLERLIIQQANPTSENPYGQSDLQAAYNAWFSKMAAYTSRNILLERTSGVAIAEYNNASDQAQLRTAVDNIGPGAVLTIPKEANVRLLEGWEGAAEAFHRSMEYDDRQILQALLVPPLVAGGQVGEGGSLARTESNFDGFLLLLERLKLDLKKTMQRHFIRPLIDYNFGPQPRYPTFDIPAFQEEDLERLARIYHSALEDGYANLELDAPWMRQKITMQKDAPPGFKFEKPRAESPFSQGEGFGRVFARRVRLAAQDAGAVIEAEDDPAGFDLFVGQHEASLRSKVTEAALSELRRLLNNPPQDTEGAALMEVDAAWLRGILDDVSEAVLFGAVGDQVEKWRRLGKAAVADRIEEAFAAPELQAGLLDRIRAWFQRRRTAISNAALAYAQWADAFNQARAQQFADDLRNRLRVRVVQAYGAGAPPDRIAGVIRDEFQEYVGKQLDSAARTIVTDYVNSAREATMDAAGDYVAGKRFVAVEDTTTTPFCRAINGRSIRKDDPEYARLSPPFDHQCRTMPVPVLAEENWSFDDDWPEWLADHANDKGGRFVYD